MRDLFEGGVDAPWELRSSARARRLALRVSLDGRVQVVVPLPAGSVVDVMARTFAQVVESRLGQKLVVINREGGGFTIAMNAVASAPADGYTLAFTPHTPLTIQVIRMKDLPYRRESFVPVCQTYDLDFLLAVGPGSPFADMGQLLAYARANPGRLRYATSGVATVLHLAAADLWQRAGVQLVDVPYKGEALFAPNLISGEVDVAVVAPLLASSGRVRPLMAFGEHRLPRFPDVPTGDELGYPARTAGWGGLFVRAGTPPAVMARLDAACSAAVNDPAYRQVAERQFLISTYLDRASFAARVDAEYVHKERLLRTLGLLGTP
jgi:tripartite-type tricarboxylate transporter receptor subunit TctC